MICPNLLRLVIGYNDVLSIFIAAVIDVNAFASSTYILFPEDPRLQA